MSNDKPIASDKPKPKPRSSKITTSLMVEEGDYRMAFDYAGVNMSSGNNSLLHVKHGDLILFRDLLTFGHSEWMRAKEIEKGANEVGS